MLELRDNEIAALRKWSAGNAQSRTLEGTLHVMYVNFWELIIAFPNGGQWAPFSKVYPP